VRQLLPTEAHEIDPLDLYPTLDRPTPPDRPWLIVNMIASADGATELDGVSGGLGGPADRLVFRAIRASSDWIVVGAGTVRAERYGPPRLPDGARDRRIARGLPADPRMAVVTGRFDLDPTMRLFAEKEPGEPRPLVVTGTSAPATRIEALVEAAEVVVLDDSRPTPAAILAELGSRGARVVLSEGGPSFNGQLASAGLIDELCLSVSPLVVGGPSSRIARAEESGAPLPLTLTHLLEQDSLLFARYVRT
jgi:riboflavin biosynthesis pyrimidine reductase